MAPQAACLRSQIAPLVASPSANYGGTGNRALEIILMLIADAFEQPGRGMWRYDNTEIHGESAVASRARLEINGSKYVEFIDTL